MRGMVGTSGRLREWMAQADACDWMAQADACASLLREGWERQRPGAEADVEQAGHGDRRKPVAGRSGTRLAERGL